MEFEANSIPCQSTDDSCVLNSFEPAVSKNRFALMMKLRTPDLGFTGGNENYDIIYEYVHLVTILSDYEERSVHALEGVERHCGIKVVLTAKDSIKENFSSIDLFKKALSFTTYYLLILHSGFFSFHIKHESHDNWDNKVESKTEGVLARFSKARDPPGKNSMVENAPIYSRYIDVISLDGITTQFSTNKIHEPLATGKQQEYEAILTFQAFSYRAYDKMPDRTQLAEDIRNGTRSLPISLTHLCTGETLTIASIPIATSPDRPPPSSPAPLLTPHDEINRRRGYSTYLPSSLAEMVNYLGWSFGWWGRNGDGGQCSQKSLTAAGKKANSLTGGAVDNSNDQSVCEKESPPRILLQPVASRDGRNKTSSLAHPPSTQLAQEPTVFRPSVNVSVSLQSGEGLLREGDLLEVLTDSGPRVLPHTLLYRLVEEVPGRTRRHATRIATQLADLLRHQTFLPFVAAVGELRLLDAGQGQGQEGRVDGRVLENEEGGVCGVNVPLAERLRTALTASRKDTTALLTALLKHSPAASSTLSSSLRGSSGDGHSINTLQANRKNHIAPYKKKKEEEARNDPAVPTQTTDESLTKIVTEITNEPFTKHKKARGSSLVNESGGVEVDVSGRDRSSGQSDNQPSGWQGKAATLKRKLAASTRKVSGKERGWDSTLGNEGRESYDAVSDKKQAASKAPAAAMVNVNPLKRTRCESVSYVPSSNRDISTTISTDLLIRGKGKKELVDESGGGAASSRWSKQSAETVREKIDDEKKNKKEDVVVVPVSLLSDSDSDDIFDDLFD